jgi:hypothetical protein
MSLLDYTSYETVRGVLGVAPQEVEDEVLALPLYAQEVEMALEDLNASLPGLYEVIRGKSESTRTALEKRLFNLVQVYAAYWVAKVLLGGSIELFSFKRLTDGKAQQERVDDPFDTLRETINASLSVWKGRIGTTLNALDPQLTVAAAPTRTFIGAAPIAVDPVTGV